MRSAAVFDCLRHRLQDADGGDSIEDVLADYPSVTAEDLSAVFAFAGSLAQFEDIPYSESVVAQ